MAELKPAEVWHPSVFIKEELAERGWTMLDMVLKAKRYDSAKELGIALLAWEMYLEIGPENPRMMLGEEMAQELGAAFDVNPQTFLNLHESWRAHSMTRAGTRRRRRGIMQTVEQLLYRAIRELAYIQAVACEHVSKKNQGLIASAEGAAIVDEGIKLLGVADLSEDEYTGTTARILE